MVKQQGSDAIVRASIDFFGIDQRDWSNLPRIARAVEQAGTGALDRFYAKIMQTPEVARFFSDPGRVQHAKSKQLDHWRYLFTHEVDATYIDKAETIGLVHARIGLEPRWYIGGYARVLEDMIGALLGSGVMPLSGRRARGPIGTLIKLALLDMTVALSAYFKAEEQNRTVVIERLGQALSALAEGDFTHPSRGCRPSSASLSTTSRTCAAGSARRSPRWPAARPGSTPGPARSARPPTISPGVPSSRRPASRSRRPGSSG